MTATRRVADLYVVSLGKYLDGIDTISTRLNASMWFLVVSRSTVASLSRSFLPFSSAKQGSISTILGE
jgi:hypothetical protein